MEKRHLTPLLLLALLLMPATSRAEGDDVDLCTEVNVEKKLTKAFSLEAGGEYRSRGGMAHTDRWSGNIGAEMKLTPWLKAAAGYSLLYDHNEKLSNSGKKRADYWGTRHRAHLSLTGSATLGKFTLSLRERWQYTYRPEQTVDRIRVADGLLLPDDKTYRGKCTNLWREKVQVKYKLTKMWRPYIGHETYMGGSGWDKMRITAGTEIRLNKKHSIDVGYLFQRVFNDDEEEGNRHLICVGYNFKF